MSKYLTFPCKTEPFSKLKFGRLRRGLQTNIAKFYHGKYGDMYALTTNGAILSTSGFLHPQSDTEGKTISILLMPEYIINDVTDAAKAFGLITDTDAQTFRNEMKEIVEQSRKKMSAKAMLKHAENIGLKLPKGLTKKLDTIINN